ncbi:MULTISPECIES: competence type IV pilus minor pilin ComGF [unclassified Lysinibacillus]|uniref:competence type IV pilus minor pilin ComGF n=1 Tax=unclassified Lysinibacillus TaxID=2636778 RepID=UPI00116DEE8D|nr:competence type IV pilus minor pilin ComGF [Lysinibacillus sp. CD3-6]QPQ35151.1 ComGF family competence protein [Lysinibacillus sp. JNUCC-52]UED78848.1 ComGF family competence protein [Lysinibacillus sp. CD3-6]
MNEKGYTLLEALFQLIVFVLVCHLFLLVILWAANMKTTMLTDEQSKWELFVFDMNMHLANASSITIRRDQRRITLQASNTLHHFDCYRNMIREQVNGGHVPMLIGINKCQFDLNDNELTIAVEFPSGLKKERTYYVPIFEK